LKWNPRPPHRKTRRACPGEWLAGVALHVANNSLMPNELTWVRTGTEGVRDLYASIGSSTSRYKLF
jgi:hypothetical protein